MFESMKPHLVELRKRMAIAIAAVFVMFIIAFVLNKPILTWVTQPLNDALIQVKIMVEKREDGTWKVQHPDLNTTAHPASHSTPSKVSSSALKLHDNLSQASTILADRNATPTDLELSKLLKQASVYAQDIARDYQTLIDKIEREHNATTPAAKASSNFWGSITTHQVGGAFFVALKVSFFASILFALPVILWQLWLFVAPGLYDNEKKMVLPFVIGGTVMFGTGVLFAYYVVTPFGFQFLITFGSFLYTPLINIEDYVGFFTKILMGFGIAFELPVVAYFLGLIGLITDQTLIRFFRYAIVMIFVLAALLTPPDILTQVLMAAPLIILYGASIIILKFVNPESKEADESQESTPTPQPSNPAPAKQTTPQTAITPPETNHRSSDHGSDTHDNPDTPDENPQDR